MHVNTFDMQVMNHKEYASSKLYLESRPFIENIELISLCNLKCPICVEPPRRRKNMLSLDDIKYIVEKNQEILNGQHIWLHHYGEPLLHPELPLIVNYLENNGIRTRLSTNATLLNSKVSTQLIESGLTEIVFSIDGTNKEDYEKIRLGANYDLMIANVQEFLELKQNLQSAYPITQAQYINFSNSLDEVGKFISFWKPTPINWINIKSPSTRANSIIDKNLQEDIKNNSSPYLGKCFWLWSSMIILSDGNVIPCCTDLKGSLVVGNIFDLTLKHIWNSESMIKIRKEHILGDYEKSVVCRDCPEKKGYGLSFDEKYSLEKKLKTETQEIIFNHHRLIKND